MTEQHAAHPTEPPPITRELDLSPLQRKTVKKSVMGAMAGNAIEWFDYGIYGYLAVHLSPCSARSATASAARRCSSSRS